jgi:argininosuccinate lyase
MKTKQTQRLWGAGFVQKPSDAVIGFTAGRDVVGSPAADAALMPYDMWVNQAHCVMLVKQGILPVSDAAKILEGLKHLDQLVKEGSFVLDPSKEDVHTNIESWLTEKLGIDVAGKLHTARSRNDQVTTDMRLFIKHQILAFVEQMLSLSTTLSMIAQAHKDTVLPGFTHHQHAMVTTMGHVLAGFAAMMVRDSERLLQWLNLHNTSLLGSVASYGTSFPIDAQMTASLLGFEKPSVNSMDAITNRWEPEVDYVFALSICMNHLSSLAQTLILWATPEFGMVTFADQFTTGSSLMPQKKNPDPLEVVKGKASVLHGQVVSLLGLGKANFIGYNRDTQWTKYILMDACSEVMFAPSVLAGMIQTMAVHKDQMHQWSMRGMVGATSLLEQYTQATYLPFRVSKMVIEKAVAYSVQPDMVNYGALMKAQKEEGIDASITRKQVRDWQDPKEILHATHSGGGPGGAEVEQSLRVLQKDAKSMHTRVNKYKQVLKKAKTTLEREIQTIIQKGAV